MRTRDGKTDGRSKSRILICTEESPLENFGAAFEPEFVSGPLECLSLATNRMYDNILIDLFSCEIIKRKLLFSLCRVLKNNPLTSGIEVIAILAGQDYAGVEKLHELEIDRVFLVPAEMTKGGTAVVDFHTVIYTAQRTRELLSVLCPFIGYNPVDKIAACGAHADRLVLSGKRMATLCCSNKHKTCEFFLNPPAANKAECAARTDRHPESVCASPKYRKAVPDDETQE